MQIFQYGMSVLHILQILIQIVVVAAGNGVDSITPCLTTLVDTQLRVPEPIVHSADLLLSTMPSIPTSVVADNARSSLSLEAARRLSIITSPSHSFPGIDTAIPSLGDAIGTSLTDEPIPESVFVFQDTIGTTVRVRLVVDSWLIDLVVFN